MKALQVQGNAKAETVNMLTCERIVASKYAKEVKETTARKATPKEIQKLMTYYQGKRH